MSQAQTPRLSIVVPHKDTPDLLRRLLESVPDRPDIEVIVVDDHSAALPVVADARVRVMRPAEGRGAGNARNVGMEAAQGQWVLFADADDYFTPALTDVLRRHLDSPADVVFFGARAVMEGSGEPSNRADHLRARLDQWQRNDQRDTAERWLRYCFGEPWCKLIRRHLLLPGGPRLDARVSIHEDTRFCYQLGLAASSVDADPAEAYCITERPGSLSTGRTSKQLLDRVRVFALREKELAEAGVLTEDVLRDDLNRWHYDQTFIFLMSRQWKEYREARRILRQHGMGGWRLWTHVNYRTVLKNALAKLRH